MHTTLSTLLIGTDAAVETIRATLTGEPDAVTARCTVAGFRDGLDIARRETPDVVMVVIDGDVRAAHTLISEINRALPVAQVVALSRDDTPASIVRAMRAGATEFLGLPLDGAEARKALIKAATLSRLAQPPPAAGKLWAVYSPTGGAGVTTTVANLGTELHTICGRSVCLVDLDFQSGDLALALNLSPVYTIVDIALNFRRLDSVFLQGTLTRHASGIYLLAAPAHGGVDVTAIPADHVRIVIELLRAMYDVIIIDTPRVLAEETLTAMASATHVILLLEPSLPSLRGYHRTVKVLDAIGVPPDRVEVVLTRHGRSRAEIPRAEIQRSLDLPLHHVLPNENDTALEATNRGVPLREVRRSSQLRRRTAALAAALAGAASARPPAQWRKGILRGLVAP